MTNIVFPPWEKEKMTIVGSAANFKSYIIIMKKKTTLLCLVGKKVERMRKNQIYFLGSVAFPVKESMLLKQTSFQNK